MVVLQVRTNSTRLPRKALLEVNDRPMIEWQIKRIQESSVQKLVIATTSDRSDDELSDICAGLDVEVFRGSSEDVVSRFHTLVAKYNPDYFIRLTGDCPLVMPEIINSMIFDFEHSACDYLSNTQPATFPDGLDVEIIDTQAFFKLLSLGLSKAEKEHVTLGFQQYSSMFKLKNFAYSRDLSEERWTVDYYEDFEFIRSVYSKFQGRELDFDLAQVLDLLKRKEIRSNQLGSNFRNIALRTNGNE
jgi:spore coat polysaccharide biosynthesis protein SpsF (cytidylyltransferase family)